MAVQPIPEGYHSITPYLVIEDAAGCIEFMKKAFSGEEIVRMAAPDGTVMHAEVRLGDSIVMIGGASKEIPPRPAGLLFYVQDVDAVYKQAISAGAVSNAEPENKFYGDRMAAVKDSFGNEWYIATHVEDVAPEEMDRRAREAMGGQG